MASEPHRFHSAQSAARFNAMNEPPDLAELKSALIDLGCPAEKSEFRASQLDKRARQLMEQQGRSYDEALTHLINLMKQGWAAKERGH